MITLNQVAMGFTQRTLFKGVSLSIFPKEKIGLTGPNGAGKTTLFSIILGQIEPLEGTVQKQKNIHIGYLPQEARFDSTRTVMEEMTAGDQRIARLLDEKRLLEDRQQVMSARYGDVLEELERLGLYEREHQAEKILAGLGFAEEDVHRPVAQLSGGWQMRTLMAKLLVCPYDVLLLDEPTNYLDLNATLWLKDYLSGYAGSFVLISHDRDFLNAVTNYTIVLEGARMTKLKGNYEAYETQKEVRLKTLEKRQKVVEKKRQQLERFTQRFHAQPNRAAAVRNKRKMIERLEQIDLPQEVKSVGRFQFDDVPSSGYVVVRTQGLRKAYGDKRVYTGLNFEIVRGQKVCLVGPNGAGKSTLLKMLAGVVEPDGGEVVYGHQVTPGYFSQTRLDVLNPDRNAFEEVMAAAPAGTPALRARTLLGLFNFHGDDVFKPVRVLSGGEKSRLILARLLIHPPNFMLLDEPTTHLDLDGVKALTEAFKAYTGTMCFISHDLFFIREVADHIAEIRNGEARVYPGGLAYYLEKTQGRPQPMESPSGKASSRRSATTKPKKPKAKDRKANPALTELQRRHQQALKRLRQIKNELRALDQEQKELETESYVKSRYLSEHFDQRGSATLKEYGRRLKWIQSRLRQIESARQQLKEERDRISK